MKRLYRIEPFSILRDYLNLGIIMCQVVVMILTIAGTMATACAIFIALATPDPEWRLDINAQLRHLSFGVTSIKSVLLLWTRTFHTLFGKGYFSVRYFFVVPIYTLVLSVALFAVWFSVVYVFRNKSGTFFSEPSPNMVQGMKDFYLRGGILAAVVIDYVSILTTKKAVRVNP